MNRKRFSKICALVFVIILFSFPNSFTYGTVLGESEFPAEEEEYFVWETVNATESWYLEVEFVRFTVSDIYNETFNSQNYLFMNYTLESLVTAIKKSLKDSVSKGNLTDYKFVSEKFDTVNGHKVYDYTIVCKSPKSTITKDLMKRRTVYFITPDNMYSVRIMAPPDKYDQCLEDFISTVESLEIEL